MRRITLVLALTCSCALMGSVAEATPVGETSAAAERERGGCMKRVDGVMRDIYSRHRIGCRKAKRVMTRYILRRDLARRWRCSNAGSIGKCADTSDSCYVTGSCRPRGFAFAPGTRA
jgi:hypothetical protein